MAMSFLACRNTFVKHCFDRKLTTALWRSSAKWKTTSSRNYNIAACMPEAAAFPGVGDHSGLYEYSVNEGERFWGAVGRQRLSWITPFHTVQDCTLSEGKIRWFEGGQLNASALWRSSTKWKTTSSRNYNLAACMPEAAAFPGVGDHSGLYEYSVNEGERFWGAVGRQRLSWITPFHTVQDCTLSEGKIRWFEGGQLNASVNCLDRHIHTCPERVALIWEKDEPGTEVRVTYRQLLELTCRLGNVLKRQGVRKGDRVTIYMPPCPLAVAAMLACARIGAVHTVVFAGFSSEALADRIRDAQSKLVITSNQALRGGRTIELKKTVDQAVKDCPSVTRVLVAMRTENQVQMTDRDIPLEEYVFNYHDGDVFGCVADIGWITGHSYAVYGPLCNGGTTVLFESTPVYPDPGRYWETVERLRINQFYGAPTAIRLLLKYGDQWVKKYDRSVSEDLRNELQLVNEERERLASELKRTPQLIERTLSEARGQFQTALRELQHALKESSETEQRLGKQRILAEEGRQEAERRLSELHEQLQENAEVILVLRTDLAKQQDQYQRALQEKVSEAESLLHQELREMESRLNAARREHTKAVVALRQLERQVGRERERAREAQRLLEEQKDREAQELQRRLRDSERDKNLLMATLRQEGLLTQYKRNRSAALQSSAGLADEGELARPLGKLQAPRPDTKPLSKAIFVTRSHFGPTGCLDRKENITRTREQLNPMDVSCS
ncbi:UNVERIFIED_CONTAM: hypothetical protein FKN15_027379 [Acipenser sinensis]